MAPLVLQTQPEHYSLPFRRRIRGARQRSPDGRGTDRLAPPTCGCRRAFAHRNRTDETQNTAIVHIRVALRISMMLIRARR